MHEWETRMLLRHYLERGVSKAERIKPGAVKPADAAVGRGDPQKALAVLVEVFDVHPSQPIKDRVLMR